MQPVKFEQAASRDDAIRHTRRDNIREDIAKRLRNICSHLSDAEFRKLVESMTEQKLKGERSRTV